LSCNICGDYAKVWKDLSTIAKKYVFQKEQSENGYVHFQGRISLIKKKSLAPLLKLLENTCLHGCHVSPTSNAGSTSFNYVMKLDTRIEGLWDDTTDMILYVPRQVRDISLRPWQEDVVMTYNIWNTRVINVLIDKVGNIGKSTLVSYMRCNKLARKVPPVHSYKDIMRMVCDMPISTCYLIDMPRGVSHESQLYTAIEEIKSGYAWDDRYKFREVFFDCPTIWIFTNKKPDNKLMSADRWKLWEVSEDQKLQVFTEKKEKKQKIQEFTENPEKSEEIV
jgi:hypothetical protein